MVTGGSGGIGKGCAAKLCELGYDVVLAARREAPLRAAADEIGARYVVADASDPDGFGSAISGLDTIDLVVYEQQPYARWGAARLVNRQGRIFSVAGTDGLQGLPRLDGPDDRLADVLQFYAQCLAEFTGSGLVIDAVTLSPRGGWRIGLASGASIEVGRDDAQERLKRFLDVWPRLGTAQGAPAYIDLRYENGFAMRWPEPAADGNRESGIGNGQPQAATLRPVPDPFPTDLTTLLAATRLTALAIPDSRFPIPGPP